MRILLVEDDPMIGKSLQAALQQDHYTVDWVKDGQAGKFGALHITTDGHDVTVAYGQQSIVLTGLDISVIDQNDFILS